MKINKRDRVILPDGFFGEVLEVYAGSEGSVLKIRRLVDNEELYFEENKVTLKKRNLRSLLANLIGRNPGQ